jgi:hypothetical protein
MKPSLALSFLLLHSAALQEEQAAEHYRPAVADEAELELEAYWEPCKDSLYHLFAETPALRAPSPSEPKRRYGAASFRPPLPEEPVALGEVWRVEAGAVLAFLSQFHPGARVRSDFFGGEVPGTWATLRAVGPEAFEVLLRAHAVLHLEDGVVYKPAQFEGRLVLGRSDGALRSFSLALPSRDTNVDVNVPQGDGPPSPYKPMMADIGWVPRMELTGGAAAPAWTRSIPDEEARLALRRAFYPFAALDWLPFEEAVRAARERKKPLHLVLVFGCLDDDSC